MSHGEIQKYHDYFWNADHSFTDRERRRVADVIDLIPASAESCLDLGAGAGALSKALVEARPGIRVTAVDWSEAALKQSGVPSTQADIADVPLPDAFCDIVLCCEVIEHLHVDSYRRVLGEMSRLARQYVLVTVPNRERLSAAWVRCPSCGCEFHSWRHVRSFHPQDMASLFDDFGTVEIREIGPTEPSPRLWARGLRRFLGVGANAFSPLSLCPQCGFRAGSRDDSMAAELDVINVEGAAEAKKGFPPWVKNWVTVHKKRPWLAALYQRAGKTGI